MHSHIYLNSTVVAVSISFLIQYFFSSSRYYLNKMTSYLQTKILTHRQQVLKLYKAAVKNARSWNPDRLLPTNPLAFSLLPTLNVNLSSKQGRVALPGGPDS